FNQLMTFGDAKRLLKGFPSAKRQSFAAQAKALDIAELRQQQPQKGSSRHTPKLVQQGAESPILS
ncbi:MAG: hypothetical protein LH702_08550, partial [Phormidesmis sp. CAN_BIN44]|nr:hypothetical protein [Phormidesmis sp. CAN_BIN44]